MEELRNKFRQRLENVAGVELNVYPLYDQMYTGIKYEMPVLVQVLTGKLPESYRREPINLCVVLDRSGSMSKTLENCKIAIENIVNNLQTDDTIHLVVYDDRVDTVFKGKHSDDKNEILQLLKGVKARGTTDIFSGVRTGIKLLQQSESVGTKVVLLFSDGMANVGIKDGEKIGMEIKNVCGDDEIYISSYGIGSSYDEKLLSSISRVGGGKYFYIDDIERIPYLVELGIDNLTRFWSKDAKLTVFGQGHTKVTYFEGCDEIFTGRRMKLREYSFGQYLVKGELYNFNENRSNVEAFLKYQDYLGLDQLERKLGSWNLRVAKLGGELELRKHPSVECYMTMKNCSEINGEVSKMIEEKKPEREIIKKKEQIVNSYENVLDKDEFYVIPALLERERQTLEEFRKNGIYAESSKKKFNYNASMAVGYSNQVYSYADEEECESEDMGFDLFA